MSADNQGVTHSDDISKRRFEAKAHPINERVALTKDQLMQVRSRYKPGSLKLNRSLISILDRTKNPPTGLLVQLSQRAIFSGS